MTIGSGHNQVLQKWTNYYEVEILDPTLAVYIELSI